MGPWAEKFYMEMNSGSRRDNEQGAQESHMVTSGDRVTVRT